MPNIIEQQDLLKGLPDNRLALLMQQPQGDIPPFLVAAEAQRRQSIRQQFAGSANKESVVDTLTKSLSGVPQNLNVPMTTPPKMPPPMAPPMAPQGIAAIQQPQQMADGGQVRRFYEGGTIEPMWQIPDYSGVIPRVADWVGSSTKGIYDWATTSYGDMKPSDPEIGDTAPERQKIPIPTPRPDDLRPIAPAPAAATGREDSSTENVAKAQEEDFRKRLEGYYADQEPDSWEKAQKWFAMSEQFLDPKKTTMQSIAGAGAAFADSMAAQSRSERENERAKEEALLKYDMGLAEDRRASESARLKAQTDVATGQLDDLYRQQRDVAERLQSIDFAAQKGEIEATTAEQMKKTLGDQMDAIGSKISAYEKFISSTYGFQTIPVVDTQNNRISFPGT